MRRLAKGSLLDTNVLLRFLLGDDPRQSPQAKSLMERLQSGAETAELTDGVIAETVWMLEKGLRVPRSDIARHLASIVSIAGVTYSRGKRNLLRAIASYRLTDCDVVDCLLASLGKARGRKVYTFDSTDFRKLDSAWEEPR